LGEQMTSQGMPEPFETIDQQIDSGDFSAAERALAQQAEAPELQEMLRIKLDVRRGGTDAALAMQRLVALMRNHTKLPKAIELYREVSALAYRQRQSSLAHSHPPPPDHETS